MAKHAAHYAARATAKQAGEPTSPEAVIEAYNAGSSEDWRTFLKVLAHESLAAKGGWVGWKPLCDAIGIDRRKGAGMLGAAQKRLNGRMPFEREQLGDNYRFRMSGDVADTIIALATGNSGGGSSDSTEQP
ncbi:hypothetical protein Q5530_26735 [Saccharothrix sp. BKS2]|uniref:hypothetical protein n=1 Tax=Saccharothrix sp. BKS2 TaxID=3064400 RepID=UPI0039E79F35